MKTTLSLSLLMLFLIPAQLCAVATTIKIFKNQEGKTITLVGYLPMSLPENEQIPDEYLPLYLKMEEMKNVQRADFLQHLRTQKNALIVLDPSVMDKSALKADVIAVDNFQKNTDTIESMPNDVENVLKVYNLDYYHMLLQKCVGIKTAIAQLNNVRIKKHFDTMHKSLIPLEEKIRYFSSIPADVDFDLGTALDYEEVVKTLITVERELYSYLVLAQIANPMIQNDVIYVCIADAYIDSFVLTQLGYKNIATLADYLHILGYSEVFSESTWKQDEDALEGKDDVALMKALALDLKPALRYVGNV